MKAFISPPTASTASAISEALWSSVPLKSRCSRKCDAPASSRGSSRDPTPTQNPTLPKVGEKFLGTVVKTAAFGAFISLVPGRDGLLHISKVGNGKRVEKVEDFLNVGDKIEVQIADIDQRGKIYLDKVRAEGEEAPAESAGGERPAARDRGDRGDRAPRGDRGDRAPRESSGGEGGGDSGDSGEGGDNPRRRRTRRD